MSKRPVNDRLKGWREWLTRRIEQGGEHYQMLDDLRAHLSARDCKHPEECVAFKVTSSGRRKYVRQCVNCLHCSDAIPVASIMPQDLKDAQPRKDVNLMWAKISEITSEAAKLLRETESREWRSGYNEYLSSPEWRDIRARVMTRDKGVCQACLIKPAELVHHLSYKHVKHEPAFELMSVCQSCHDSIHGKTEDRTGGLCGQTENAAR